MYKLIFFVFVLAAIWLLTKDLPRICCVVPFIFFILLYLCTLNL